MLRLIHGMTPAEATERCARLHRAIEDDIVAVLSGTITPAVANKRQREHAKDLRVLEYELKRPHGRRK